MSQGGISRRELLTGRFLRKLVQPKERVAAPVAVAPLPGADSPHQQSARQPASPRRRPRVIPIFRPPGALSEALFLSTCTRCGDCIPACPHGAITLAPKRLRGAEGTPMIDAAAQPCLLCPDMPCITACEPGALIRVDKPQMGTASIDSLSCLAHQGSFCSTCHERCPVPGAITLTEGKPKVDPSSCVGCGVCQYVCPAPLNAVRLLPTLNRDYPPRPATLAPLGD